MIGIFTLGFGFDALASEYLFQADKGEHVIELDYSYRALGIDFKETAAQLEWNWNFQQAGLSYEWGFAKNMSVGLGIDYVHGNLEFDLSSSVYADWHISGIEDVSLTFKGRYAFSAMKLYYGVNADFSLEDQEYSQDKFASSGSLINGRDNASKGRHEVTPYLALEHKTSRLTYGAKLAYLIALEQRQTSTDSAGVETKSKFEGENGLFASLFLEHVMTDDSTLGYSVTYMSFEDLISKNDNNDGENSNKNYEYATNGFMFDLYGKVDFCDHASFLPKFTYYLLSDNNHKDTTFAPNTDIESSGASYKIEFKLRKSF